MRCFIALNLDDAVKDKLIEAQGWFDGLKGKVSWTRPEQMHLTVKFLGEVADEKLTDVVKVLTDAAAKIRPFQFEIGGLGCFPPSGRRLRILWVGVTPTSEMATLNDLLQVGYVDLGYEAETRKFTPHLTIGRVKTVNNPQPYRAIIGQHRDFIAGLQTCDHVTLYRSDLKPTGAVYIPIERISLTGA